FERVEPHLRRLLQRPELTAPAPKAKSATKGTKGASRAATVPMRYLAWLKAKCETLDLLGLEPKQGTAVRLHSIYVPLTTAPVAAKAGGDTRQSLRRRKATRLQFDELEKPMLLLDRLSSESL